MPVIPVVQSIDTNRKLFRQIETGRLFEPDNSKSLPVHRLEIVPLTFCCQKDRPSDIPKRTVPLTFCRQKDRPSGSSIQGCFAGCPEEVELVLCDCLHGFDAGRFDLVGLS